MGTIKRFEDLECWQAGRRATRALYQLTRKSGFQNDRDLVRQIRRAAVSVTSNIAEGFERDGNKEFINFLSIAKGSAGEIRSQLYVALDEAYISQDEFDQSIELILETSNKTAGLRNYLQKSELKGLKNK